MNRRWICSDVWMDILPFFRRRNLGRKFAMISPRFDALVDAHFDGKSELPLWRPITICKDRVAAVPKFAVSLDRTHSKDFPLPDRPLHNKIRFKSLQIKYIDHSVIAFLRTNKQIFDKGTHLDLYDPSSLTTDEQPIWNDFLRLIWPIFAQNIHHLGFPFGDYLNYLRRLISPTILTDCHQLNSINSNYLFSDLNPNGGPNATASQVLSKWLHTPAANGQPKRLRCNNYSSNVGWANNFKKKFLNATTSVSYKIQLTVHPLTPIEPFELVNERTMEKLTLIKASEKKSDNRTNKQSKKKLKRIKANKNKSDNRWILKRCQIGETTAAVQWEEENWDHLNNVIINLLDVICIGPLSPPTEEEKKKKRIKATEINYF